MHELLESCSLKVFASEQHLNRLDEAAERFFEDKTEVASIAGEANSQRTKYLFRVESVIEWPRREWGIIVGDAIHCLRSALDHLVYGLASERDTRTQFPICRTRSGSRRRPR